MYAIVVGLLWWAHRHARRLPFALAEPYDPPTRAPLVTLAIAFTVAALVGSLLGAITLSAGVVLLIVGTVTCAVWFVDVTVRTLFRADRGQRSSRRAKADR
jgi:fatty acid desaturase